MKTAKEELETEYNRLYEEADKLLREHNPCQFNEGKCIENRTVANTELQSNGCCGTRRNPCKHLGPGGCTVKALGCKLHLCPTALSGGGTKCDTELYKLRKKAYGILPPEAVFGRTILADLEGD